MRMRDTLFGGARCDGSAADLGLLVLRLIAGLALVTLHGLGKLPPSEGFVGWVGSLGIPMPQVAAWLAAFNEVGGGLLLALGLFTRPIGLLLVGHFLVVGLLGHTGQTMSDRELPLLFGAIAFAFALHGAGRFSLDALVRNRTL